ncbi:Double-stranded RNA-binding protein 6 [Dionaea muscipula]
MYKNQLQELSQRSCFNLPSYTCIREGPDHAPRFKAIVNFNGEIFESPSFCTTLRQAEHAAAEVALTSLSNRGPSSSLAARILDETGVYKNLLQEVSQRVGASLPLYTTFKSGFRHLPLFTCTVELAGVTFTGVPAKNKKQAEKNAAMAAWLTLKQLAREYSGSLSVTMNNDEQEHVTVARALQNYLTIATTSNLQCPIKFPVEKLRPSKTHAPVASSKILPLIHPKTTSHTRLPTGNATNNDSLLSQSLPSEIPYNGIAPPAKFPAAEAAPYVPIRHLRTCNGIAPPVTVRNAVPVYSAQTRPPPAVHSPQMTRPLLCDVGLPVLVGQSVHVYAPPPPPLRSEEITTSKAPIREPAAPSLSTEYTRRMTKDEINESLAARNLKELRI